MKSVLFALALVSLCFPAVNGRAAEPVPPIIDLTAIDSSVNPCDDFYHYACGQWQQSLELPADKSAYYRQFSGLQDNTDESLNKILVAYAAGDYSVPSKYAAKLGDYYASCLDTAGSESDAPAVLGELFAKVDAMQTPADLADTVAALHLQGVNVLFSFGGAQDVNDSTRFIGYVDEGGLSLPEMGYYTKTDPKSLEILQKFEAHIARLLTLTLGPKTDSSALAKSILVFEKALAQHALSLAERGDSSKVNHPLDRAALAALAPLFQWDRYFAALGVAGIRDLNAREPEFLKGLNALLASRSLESLKPYFKWQVAHALASALTAKTEKENFAFWGSYLSGQKEPLPRWRRCTQSAESALREALGEAYVSGLQGAEATRELTRTMVKDIESAFSANLNLLDWLDAPTRAAAQAKLAKVGLKVGYPDTWRNYDALTVGRAGFARNVLSVTEFESRRNLSRIGQPVDKTEWQMAPWEANAYYDPSLNEMALPMGEIVPPVQDPAASDGANLGSLGATTIGHELTHGFDSNGRQFDGDGNLREWWTPSVKAEFEKRTQCLVEQANAYEVLPGLHVEGAQVLGENLADQGGAKLALTVLRQRQARRGMAPELGGFDETQQFFLSFAQAWCAKRTDQSLRLLVTSNEHPPEEFRVNGVLFNRPEFAEAFQCKPGSRMAPVKKCPVW